MENLRIFFNKFMKKIIENHFKLRKYGMSID